VFTASKNPKKGASSPSDMNAACMMYNNDSEECLAHRACTVLPLDEANILCLSKAYISSVVGAIAKGDAKVVPTKSVKVSNVLSQSFKEWSLFRNVAMMFLMVLLVNARGDVKSSSSMRKRSAPPKRAAMRSISKTSISTSSRPLTKSK